MLLTSLRAHPADLERRTGWAVKPQGACKGEICVPLPTEVRNGDGTIAFDQVGNDWGFCKLAAPVTDVETEYPAFVDARLQGWPHLAASRRAGMWRTGSGSMRMRWPRMTPVDARRHVSQVGRLTPSP